MFGSRRRLFIYITLLLLVICSQANVIVAQNTPVEKLVTVMPDDVIGFYATSGGDRTKPAFEKSIIGRIWNDPGVQNFYQAVYKQLIKQLQQKTGDPNNVKIAEAAQHYIKLALSRPIIAGVALKQSQDDVPFFGFIILDAGPRKDEIGSALMKLESTDDEGEIVEVTIGSITMHTLKNADDLPMYWGWVDDYLVLTVNDKAGLALKYLSSPRATAPYYLKNVRGSGDALAMHFDFVKIAGIVYGAAQKEGDAEDFEDMKSTINSLGLNNVKNITVRVGFDGTDLVSSSLLEAPGPRTELLANFKAIDISMLDMVDSAAMSTVMFNFDFTGMYDTIIETMKIAAPDDVYTDVMKDISELESQTKIKIRNGLLASLAGPIVAYQIPMGVTMDMPNGGSVLVAELKDAALFEKSMSTLEQYIKTKDNEGKVQFDSYQQDDRTVHTWSIMPLTMMQVIPCWTVMDNKVVISSSLNLCNTVVDSIGSAENSIRGTEGFKKAAAKLPDNILFFKYVDSKSQFKQMMMQLQQVWPMATMFVAKEGLTLPFVLPDISNIIEDINPSFQYCWYSDAGYHTYYRGAGIEPSFESIGVTALGLGVLMPALDRVRQIAFRMQSGTNLSGIGKALFIYANDHDGQYPPDLHELVKTVDLSPKSFESRRKPKDFDGPSYIYIAGQNTSMYPGNIVVYENPEYCTDGLNVLYMDCHVQWTKKDQFLKELKETYERLGREMPEIKFKD